MVTLSWPVDWHIGRLWLSFSFHSIIHRHWLIPIERLSVDANHMGRPRQGIRVTRSLHPAYKCPMTSRNVYERGTRTTQNGALYFPNSNGLSGTPTRSNHACHTKPRTACYTLSSRKGSTGYASWTQSRKKHPKSRSVRATSAFTGQNRSSVDTDSTLLFPTSTRLWP